MSDSTKSFAAFCREYIRRAMRSVGQGEGGQLAFDVTFATRVADELDAFKRALVFSRPASLGTDLVVYETRRAARKPKASKADKLASRTFNDWRVQVMEAEAKDAANVEMLLSIAHRAASEPRARESVRRIIGHIEAEYDRRVPWPFDGVVPIGRWARSAMRRPETMPTWLFIDGRPPRYVLRGDGVIDDTDA